MSRSYYSVVPAIVRYNKNLTERAKMIYAEITALLNEHGYCDDTNGYFAALFQVHRSTISRNICKLRSEGHIRIEYLDGNYRKIWINV